MIYFMKFRIYGSVLTKPFNDWRLLKGHTFLNLELKTTGFFKYVMTL